VVDKFAVHLAPEAMRRLNGEKLIEIEVDEGLQGFAGGSVTQGLGQRLEPLRVVAVQDDEFRDRVAPALMAAAAISRSPVADYRSAGVARSITRLALGAGERLVALWLASCGHGLSGFRHVTQLTAFRRPQRRLGQWA
jgi:hypothetical protein